MFALLLLLLATAAQADCPELSFEFSGQPDCVELQFDGERTTITSECDAPILVDQSVQLTGAILPARSSAKIRDLSAFSLGMEGKLYWVVASATNLDECRQEPEAAAEVTDTAEPDTGGPASRGT